MFENIASNTSEGGYGVDNLVPTLRCEGGGAYTARAMCRSTSSGWGDALCSSSARSAIYFMFAIFFYFEMPTIVNRIRHM